MITMNRQFLMPGALVGCSAMYASGYKHHDLSKRDNACATLFTQKQVATIIAVTTSAETPKDTMWRLSMRSPFGPSRITVCLLLLDDGRTAWFKADRIKSFSQEP